MAQLIRKKSIKKHTHATGFLLLASIIMGLGLSSSFTLQSMASKKQKRHLARQQRGASVDQFNLVVQMGIWDQALAILDGTKSTQAKQAYLLGDYAQDDELDSNLHLAALRAPIEFLKKFVAHAQACAIDLPTLFLYAENEDGWPLKLSILDIAYSREYERERAIQYLKEKAFPDSHNHTTKLIARIKLGE